MLDLRLENANALTMDPARPRAGVLGIRDGRIVGVDEQITGLPARTVTDVAGATVLPGFVDAHTHLSWAGLNARAHDIAGFDDRDAALASISRAAATRPPGAWVEIAGYDQRRFGGRHLTRDELDRAADDRRIWVQHISGHACVVNSVVLEQVAGSLGADADRDRAGRLTGLLTERAQLAVRAARLPYPVADLVDAIETAGRRCLAQGITSVAEAGVGGGLVGHSAVEVGAYQRARGLGRLPVRVQLMIAADALRPAGAHPDDGIATGFGLGIHTGFGDDTLSVGAQKLWLDGGMSARTAALTRPYHGRGQDAGQLQDDPAVLSRIIVDGHRAGWQMAIHAIGDRAVDLALDAVDEAQRGDPRPDARHRIEHCGVVRPDQLERIARSGLIPVLQPEFLWDSGDDYADVLGPDRADWLYRGRSLVDRGIIVAGSSDRPVTDGAPLRGIQFMVERRSASGRVVGAGERLTVAEALAAYTRGAAYACRRETAVGTLAAGMRADLVVLGHDPTAVDPSRIAGIDILATMVGGEIRHGAL